MNYYTWYGGIKILKSHIGNALISKGAPADNFPRNVLFLMLPLFGSQHNLLLLLKLSKINHYLLPINSTIVPLVSFTCNQHSISLIAIGSLSAYKRKTQETVSKFFVRINHAIIAEKNAPPPIMLIIICTE